MGHTDIAFLAALICTAMNAKDWIERESYVREAKRIFAIKNRVPLKTVRDRDVASGWTTPCMVVATLIPWAFVLFVSMH